MKSKKIITILIITNLLLIGTVCNLVNKLNLTMQKQIIKGMNETEEEANEVTELNNQINTLQISHEEYSKYIQNKKEEIAVALTEMGVETSVEETIETMINNIRNIETGTELQGKVTGNSMTIPEDIDSCFVIGMRVRTNNGDNAILDPSYSVSTTKGTVTKIHSKRQATYNGTTGYQRSFWLGVHKVDNCSGAKVTVSSNGTDIGTVFVY